MSKERKVKRMCINCRDLKPQVELLRFVCSENNHVLWDMTGKLSSRGAFCCPKRMCLTQSVKKGAFKRAFESPVLIDIDALLGDIEKRLKCSILENLGLAFRMGQCVAGRDQVFAVLKAQKLMGVLLSEDVSVRTVDEVENTLQSAPDVFVRRIFTKLVIGKALGRSETGVVGFLKGRITERIKSDLERFWEIGKRSELNG